MRVRICRACTTPPASAKIALPARRPRPEIPAPLTIRSSTPANTGDCNPPDRASVISATRRPAPAIRASASAGKKWPPEPPAAITTGNTASLSLAGTHDVDVVEMPTACPCQELGQAQTSRGRRRTEALCPWSGSAKRRCHVDEHLEREAGHQTRCTERRRTGPVPSGRDEQAAQDDEGEHGDDDHAEKQAEFLAGDGKDEVFVRISSDSTRPSPGPRPSRPPLPNTYPVRCVADTRSR